MYEHILVPIDDSAPAQHGLNEALALARRLGSVVRILHVVDVRALISDVAGFAPAELLSEWTAMGEQRVAKALQQAKQAGVEASTSVRCEPGLRICDTILQEAQASGADLIVMGTHGRNGLKRLALGSEAELVLRESTVPVMLVRGADTPDRALAIDPAAPLGRAETTQSALRHL